MKVFKHSYYQTLYKLFKKHRVLVLHVETDRNADCFKTPRVRKLYFRNCSAKYKLGGSDYTPSCWTFNYDNNFNYVGRAENNKHLLRLMLDYDKTVRLKVTKVFTSRGKLLATFDNKDTYL